MDTLGPVIPLIDPAHAPLLTRHYLSGEPPSQLALTLAQVPESLEAVLPFLAAMYGPSQLGERLKLIAILRTSAVNGCRYCTRIYRDGAREAGLSESEIAALVSESAVDASLFTSRERAAIRFIGTFCAAPERCTALLRETFRDDEIVSLALVVGTTVFMNRFATAFGLA